MLVVGAEADDPPPGLDRAADAVELRWASWDELPDAIVEADGMFLLRVEAPQLRSAWPSAGRMRWIQSASDGVNAVLFPELVNSDVQVTNARGVFEDAIAEWVIGAMLAFCARILDQRDAQLRREWAYGTTERLAGQHLLAVGPGPIGRAVGVRAGHLGMRVGAAGRSARPDDLFGQIVPTNDLAAFDAALGDADFVLDALPLTTETTGLFSAERFRAMKGTARFINVGRGDTVDEPAMVAALADGEIGGAALDVFVEEPLPQPSPLWTMPNVLLSPHMCGDFDGWHARVVDVFVDNAGRFARGEPLRNLVDKRAGFGIG